MKELLEQITAARTVGTPLLAVSTPDQPAFQEAAVKSFNGGTPCVRWDRATGLSAINDGGKKSLGETGISTMELTVAATDPGQAMGMALKLSKRTVVFGHNLARAIREGDVGTVQGVANLRDPFKADGRTLIIMGPDIDLPAELRHDVVALDDPLPDDERYGAIVAELYESAELEKPKPALVREAVLSVKGLSAFEAEQVLAMSLVDPKTRKLSKVGLDLTSAWQMKRAAIAKVKGLTMTLDGPDLKNLRGMDSLVKTLRELAEGPLSPLVWVRVDEIEKMFAGLGTRGGPGDNTGVTQDLLQQFLVTMEDYGWTGFILVGVRGSGKTVLTRSIGAAYKAPTISMDPGAMRQKHVGESEAAVREAFRTIRSIGGNRVCVLATSNDLEVLPPEFLRRFKFGTYYFDILTAEEREALWPIYLAQWNLDPKSERPEDEGWTGSEIRNCCEIAYSLRKPIVEAAEKIIPVTKSNPQSIARLRVAAEGNWMSASYPGPFRKDHDQLSTKRRLVKES